MTTTNTRVAPPAALASATYCKSTRSSAAGNCGEVADLPGGHRAVRDSKNPAGPALIFTPTEWAAFTASVRSASPSPSSAGCRAWVVWQANHSRG